MIAQGKRLLCGRPKCHPVLLDMSDGRVGLHRKVLHSRKAEGVFKNIVSAFKTLLHIALGVTETITEVGSGKLRGNFITLPHHFSPAGCRVVHQRRARCQRFIDRGYGRQFLVLDFEQIQGLFRRRLVYRCNRGHRISDIANFIHRHDGLIFIGGAEHPEPPLIIAGDDGVNSGQRFGPAAIDASQPGMRIGTAEDFGVSHSRQFDIHRVHRFARDLFLTVHPRCCFADDVKSLSLLHSSTSIAIMLADPLHGFLAARKLSTELCFFDLFKNLVEARARGQSHGDQIPTP